MQEIKFQMMWIIDLEPPKKPYTPLAPASTEDILVDFMKKTDSFTSKIKVTEKQVVWLSSQAIGGGRSTLLWVQYLIIRLVGSNFGEGIRAV